MNSAVQLRHSGDLCGMLKNCSCPPPITAHLWQWDLAINLAPPLLAPGAAEPVAHPFLRFWIWKHQAPSTDILYHVCYDLRSRTSFQRFEIVKYLPRNSMKDDRLTGVALTYLLTVRLILMLIESSTALQRNRLSDLLLQQQTSLHFQNAVDFSFSLTVGCHHLFDCLLL
jgi:hypothetical protein